MDFVLAQATVSVSLDNALSAIPVQLTRTSDGSAIQIIAATENTGTYAVGTGKTPFKAIYTPGGRVGNMLTWHVANPGSIPGRGIHSDSDHHYNGHPVSLDPQWHIKITLETLIKGHLQARSN